MQKIGLFAVFVFVIGAACGHEHEPEPDPVEGAGEFAALQAMSDGQTFHVELAPSVDRALAAEPFDLDVHVHMADEGAALPGDLALAVDAFMASDGHGFLDGPPSVSGGEGGVFAVEGVHLNHGDQVWELDFDLTSGEVTERAAFEVIPASDGDAHEHEGEHGDEEHEH